MKSFTAGANENDVRLSRFVEGVTKDMPRSMMSVSYTHLDVYKRQCRSWTRKILPWIKGEGMESKKQQKREAFQDVWRTKRSVTLVYILLRASVILVMLAQIFNRNFENVFLCVLTLFLFCLLYTSRCV